MANDLDFLKARRGTPITAAQTITIPKDGDSFLLQGTANVALMFTNGRGVGSQFWLICEETPTFIDSDGALDVPGDANYTAVANDRVLCEVNAENQVVVVEVCSNTVPGAAGGDLVAHLADTSNPHEVTAAQVGLENVDNTSDADKPVSTDQQTALDAKANDADLTTHVEDTANPHEVSKAQVGLENVENYDISSQGEAEAGTATDKYMTPERTAQAIAALAGGGGLTENRIYQLVFPPVSPSQSFGIRAAGGSEYSEVNAGMNAAAIIAALDGNSELDGYTFQVEGSTSNDGTDPDTEETLKSGSFKIMLTGDSPYPALVIKSGEVQLWEVDEGDDGADYAYNGATGRATGQAASQRQTDIRATAGDYADVLVKGVETAYSEFAVDGNDVIQTIGGSASANSTNGATPVTNVYDGNLGTWWTQVDQNQAFPHWWRIQLNSAQTVRSYRMYFPSAVLNLNPRHFKLQGSNNGSDWTDLHEEAAETTASDEWRSYEIASPASYSYYRVYIFSRRDLADPEQSTITELELYDGVQAGALGAIHHKIFFPISVGDVAQGTASGTDSVASTLVEGDSDAVDASLTQPTLDEVAFGAL